MAKKTKILLTDARLGDRDCFKDKGKDEEKSRRPFRQDRNTEAVNHFMSCDDPIAFLRSSMTRSGTFL